MKILEIMSVPRQAGKKNRPEWVLPAISTAVIMALLVVYLVLTTPGFFKPSEITITGTITASSVNLEKITFTNTNCGTKNVANISSVAENSGVYSISLDNGYSYNVSIAWINDEDTINELEMDQLILDTFDKSMVRDWTVQP